MKFQKLCFLLLLCSSLFVISCGEGQEEEDIFGTYSMTDVRISNCSDLSPDMSLDFSGDGCSEVLGQEICGSGTITISRDSCFVMAITMSARGTSITQTIDGLLTYYDASTITLCFKDGTGCGDATYVLDNGTITFKDVEDLPTGCLFSMSGDKIN